MNKCKLCNQEFFVDLTWSSLFKFEEMCNECKGKLDKIDLSKSCKYCGNVVECCKEDEITNRSSYLSNVYMKDLLFKIKFSRDNELLSGFRDDIREITKKYYRGYVVVPVPISRKRYQERLFNQSYELAKLTGLKIEDVLIRLDDTTQSKKSLEERIKDPPKIALTRNIYNKKILLIDDIYTTGTTLRQCAKLFDKSNHILCFTLVRIKKRS